MIFSRGRLGISGAATSFSWVQTGRVAGSDPYGPANLAVHVGDAAENVRAARLSLARALGADAIAFMSPDHGTSVAQILDAPQDILEPGPIVDAMVTRVPGIALVALAADCVPIVLASRGVVAAVHCGWKGMVSGVIPAAVAAMACDEPISAIIGPSICGRCYPVGAERQELARQACDASVATAWDGQPAIDVAAGVQAQLNGLGVEYQRIAGCTFEDHGLFSYRRDSVTGRHGLAIVMSVED